MLVVPIQTWCTLGHRSIWVLVSFAFLVQSLIPKSQFFFGLNAPAWSISTEFGFYLLFPLLIHRWRETRFIKLIGCAALLAFFFFLAENLRTQPLTASARHAYIWLLYINPFVRLIEFVVGMLTANLFLFVRSKTEPSPFISNLLQLISVALVALSIVLCKWHSDISTVQQLPHAWVYWAEGSGGFLVYALLVFSMSFKSAVSGALSHPILIFLGEISFSVYLVHWIMIEIPLTRANNLSLALPAPHLFLIYAAGIFLLSVMMHLLAEKPLRRLITVKFSSSMMSRRSFETNESNLLAHNTIADPPSQPAKV